MARITTSFFFALLETTNRGNDCKSQSRLTANSNEKRTTAKPLIEYLSKEKIGATVP